MVSDLSDRVRPDQIAAVRMYKAGGWKIDGQHFGANTRKFSPLFQPYLAYGRPIPHPVSLYLSPRSQRLSQRRPYANLIRGRDACKFYQNVIKIFKEGNRTWAKLKHNRVRCYIRVYIRLDILDVLNTGTPRARLRGYRG